MRNKNVSNNKRFKIIESFMGTFESTLASALNLIFKNSIVLTSIIEILDKKYPGFKEEIESSVEQKVLEAAKDNESNGNSKQGDAEGESEEPPAVDTVLQGDFRSSGT